MIVKHFLLQNNSFTVAFLMIKTLLINTLDQVLYPHLLIQAIRSPFLSKLMIVLKRVLRKELHMVAACSVLGI